LGKNPRPSGRVVPKPPRRRCVGFAVPHSPGTATDLSPSGSRCLEGSPAAAGKRVVSLIMVERRRFLAPCNMLNEGEACSSRHYARATCCDRGYGRPSLRAVGSASRRPGVLGSRTLRRTEKVRLRSEPLRLPGGTTISSISRRRLVHNAG